MQAVSYTHLAYISWDEEQIIDWTVRYWEKARKAGLPVPPDFGDFYRDFEWMGAQRHIKAVSYTHLDVYKRQVVRCTYFQ